MNLETVRYCIHVISKVTCCPLPEENAGELARHDPAHGPQIFGVKLVSRVADWAGFSGYAVF